uniref:tRNA threonylcarbamoyladenosine biosynthesis protein TsaE n=1 Tax=candidate division CPR3 bacterium TaxID=2268181 RepID=A0A7C5YR02_UNCC3
MKVNYVIKTVKELEKIAKTLALSLKPKDKVVLIGPLGVGKTTFTKYLVKSLGGKEEDVTSPTFILIREYKVKSKNIKRVFHIDLYRIKSKEIEEDLGLDEYLNMEDSISVIEWGEKIKEKVKKDWYVIKLNYMKNGKRSIEIIGKNFKVTDLSGQVEY